MNKKKYYLFEMDINTLNILSIVIFIIMLGITYLLYAFGIIKLSVPSFGLLIMLYIPYMVLHELLHSLSYVLHGAKFKNVTYGAHLEKGVLCCLCKQNITKKNILISLIYPLFFIGIVTYILGIVIHNQTLIWLSIANITGCSGDIIMFIELLKIKDFEYSEYDNPVAFGLYSSEDLSKRKMLGLKYLSNKDQLVREDMKKVSISKISIISFIILLLIGILNILVD